MQASPAFRGISSRWKSSGNVPTPFPRFRTFVAGDGTRGGVAGENARDLASCRCGHVGTSACANTPIRLALFAPGVNANASTRALTLGTCRCGDVPRSAHDLFPDAAARCVQEREHLIERLAALGLNRRRIQPGKHRR